MGPVRQPLLPLALAYAAGIGLAPHVPTRVAWILLLASLLWGVSLVVLGQERPASAMLLLGAAAAGILRAAPLPLPPDHVARLALPRTVELEGRLQREPLEAGPGRWRLTVDVERADGEAASGRVRVTVWGSELPTLAGGQRLTLPVRLHRVAGLRNPGVYDHAAHLVRAGIHATGSARADRVQPLEPPDPAWSERTRRAFRELVGRTLPPVSAALLAGLVLGDRSGLPPDLDEAFRRAGVYHILAVSGFNVALVAAAAWAVLRLVHLGRRTSATGALMAILGFAAVVGPEPSVLRATVMGAAVLLAQCLEREPAVINSLALAALVILTARPGDLADPGFQLSFAATLGIVLAPLPRGPILGGLGVSVAAQLAVLPVALTHFNQLPLLAPLANLLVVPLAGLATVLGLASAPLAALQTTLGEVALNAAWPVLVLLRLTVAAAAAIPGAALFLPAPPPGAIVAYVLGLGLALRAWHGRASPGRTAALAGAGAGVSVALATALTLWPLVRPADGRLRLAVLDVGQGEAMVVETPTGEAVLVDAGPGGPWRFDTGERVVAPYLWNRGYLRLAAAVITHDDLDHAGGFAAVQRRFAIGRMLSPGHRYWVGGVSLLVLEVPRSARDRPRPRARRNPEAVVVRIDYGLASFLLPSDLTAAGEAALLAVRAPLAATVLKVAHHGSRHASTPAFLAGVDPRWAVISVGARNAYGHPAPETMARLAALGIPVARTDRDGAVIFETDGRELTVTRWALRRTDRLCLEPEGHCAERAAAASGAAPRAEAGKLDARHDPGGAATPRSRPGRHAERGGGPWHGSTSTS